ncbi:Homeodomain-interacting protein kinase 2 [Collichthys lucidus]|uniref:Homeodomain-interacting protein kinase 2 n=1 Tax=Collichthys lucidus TaxID=240159 RepID=A0A4U5V286_COLLU|nr:Homeodomain-interacting protein kinase 2 [Collichthys lucidus]
MNQFSINTNTASDLQISHGTTLGQFHKVESILGEGGFGFVTRCLNVKTNRQEAIKIFKNSRNTVQNAKLEICILKRLRCLDPDTCNIVRWNGFFFDQDRICLNFDLMDLSLYTFLKERNFEGLTTPELRPVIAQLATALSHLRSIGLVHADLKPDNVMIVDRYQTPLQVRLIDFGLAHPVAAVKPGTCVQTTYYRAPEVTLHLPFNDAIDMWSLGITAAELSTGYPLYPGNTDYDVLRFIFQTQGQPSDNVLDRGLGTGYYFDRDQTNGHWTFKSPEDFAEQTGIYAVDTREYRLENLDALVNVMEEEIEVTHQGQLVDLIKRMLHLDPDLRIKPLEVLRHPFFDITSSSSADPVTTMDDGPADLAVSIENTEEAENNENMLEDQLVDNAGYGQAVINTNTASDLQISHGTTLGQFHKVESILGEGGFGFVTRCLNVKTNRQEAIKIFKNSRNTVQNAKLEICILKRLRCLDPDTCNIVRWNGFFFDQDRICLNFDLMDLSLYTFLKERNFEGLTTPELRPVIAQLATALSHLRSIGLVHADLKPDNVMIVDRYQTPLQVRLIDFGLAHPVAAVKPGTCVQTTYYRAPEVTLHLPFNDAIDMWSLGITAAELSTGYPLYPGNTDYDVLRFIFQTQGQPSDNVLDRGLGTGFYFDRDQTNGHWTFKSPEDFAEQTGIYAVDTREYRLENLDALVNVMEEEIEVTHQGQLVDLIKRMLHLDPDLRIKPLEVLRHPFFDITSSSSADPVTTMDDGPADLAVSIENTEEAENNENMLEDQLVDNTGYGQTRQVINFHPWLLKDFVQ